MTHVQMDLGAYVLGGLEPAEEERIRAHLAECSECAAAHAELEGLPQLLDLAVVAGAGEEDPEGLSIERAMLGWQVAGALEKLTPEHRQVIRLAHVQGLAVREIAERLGLPEGTVKSRTWYALRSLRLVLEEMGVRAA